MKQRITSLWKAVIGDASPARIFLLLLAASWISVLISAPISLGESLKNLFFLDCNDAFMDFFNSMRDVAQGIGVYTERKVIYPPMANLLFLIFSKMMPSAYLNTDFDHRYEWLDHTASFVAIILFLVLSAVAFYASCRSFSSKQLNVKLLSVVFLFSEVFIFGMERGNIVVLSTAATLFFLFNYDSQSKLLRELALLAIAFAFSIKLYPIAFAWLLLTKKRFKEFARCALYSILLLILPSFFFGGPISLIWLLQNTLAFTQDRSDSTGVIQPHLWMQAAGIKPVFYALFVIAAILFLLLSFIRKDRQKNLILLCTVILAFPAFQSVYAWALFIAPLLLFFEEKKWSALRIVYFVLLVVPMLPIPIAIGTRPFSEFLVPTVALLLLLLCIGDGIYFLVKHFRNRKALAADTAEK